MVILRTSSPRATTFCSEIQMPGQCADVLSVQNDVKIKDRTLQNKTNERIQPLFLYVDDWVQDQLSRSIHVASPPRCIDELCIVGTL